jgi:hypothetical protein
VIHNTFNIKRKGFKDFLQVINEAYKCEFEHAKSMKKIYELNYTITQEGYEMII